MNIQDRMAHYHVPGVSVAYFDNAKLQWSKCFGIMEKGADRAAHVNSIFHACSVSKMITALCVLRLVQDRVLDLSRNVNEYLTVWKIPDSQFTDDKKITLAGLLSHQAGFYDCEGSFEPWRQGDLIPKPVDLLNGTTHFNREEVCAKYVPMQDFCYSDAGYCVVAQVLNDTTGETVPQIAKRVIFDPLALRRTFFWEIGKDSFPGIDMIDCVAGHDSQGEIVEGVRAHYPNTEGAGLWTTPSELAQIVIDMVKAYHGMDSVILDRNTVKHMLAPYGCAEYMGMGVFLEKDEHGEPYFFSQGWGVGMQCKLRVYYQSQRGVIVMTNSEPGMEQDKALIGEIIEHVCKNDGI